MRKTSANRPQRQLLATQNQPPFSAESGDETHLVHTEKDVSQNQTVHPLSAHAEQENIRIVTLRKENPGNSPYSPPRYVRFRNFRQTLREASPVFYHRT